MKVNIPTRDDKRNGQSFGHLSDGTTMLVGRTS